MRFLFASFGVNERYGDVTPTRLISIAQPAFLSCTKVVGDRPKEAVMGGHPFQEIPCTVCNRPLDLRADLGADENGKAVHEDCYFHRIILMPKPTLSGR